MKRLTLVLAAVAVAFYLSGTPALAQHGHGGGPPAGPGAGASHGPSGTHGPSANPSSQPSTAGPKSATDLLKTNTKLDSKLTAKLQSQGLLPKGTDLKDACSGFRNLGQCIAAIHVSHNLGGSCTFTNLKTAVTTGAKDSLGQAIHGCDPGAKAKAEAKKGQRQAHDDLKESSS